MDNQSVSVRGDGMDAKKTATVTAIKYSCKNQFRWDFNHLIYGLKHEIENCSGFLPEALSYTFNYLSNQRILYFFYAQLM